MPSTRRLLLIPLILGLAAATLVYAATTAGLIEIRGLFEPGVHLNPSRLTLDLGRVTDPQGSRTFPNAAKLVITAENTSIRFRLDPATSHATGDLKLILNANAHLGDRTIQMPCLYANTSCARILAILPGYDVPMPIPPGEYPGDLTLTWHSVEGSGSLTVTVVIEYT